MKSEKKINDSCHAAMDVPTVGMITPTTPMVTPTLIMVTMVTPTLIVVTMVTPTLIVVTMVTCITCFSPSSPVKISTSGKAGEDCFLKAIVLAVAVSIATII